ncbi:hypothetical protein HJC23_000160 [Cyclotella cryptica]|uniref:Uncharacterized protein n=1 Tax=Cyclotella cryptica TaxID=29204 RepID=A0ABD3QFF7_9STRA|eukprot:CCRYP_006322-RA/>CCRYP_006322-RA protein AED:0.20 eAED:0.18 QI:0/-1/0/1/-1/1/1/0/358
MIVSIRGVAVASIAIASSNAFAPRSGFRKYAAFRPSCSLQATEEHQELDIARRRIFHQTLTGVSSAFLLPRLANANADLVASTTSTPSPIEEKKEVLLANAVQSPPEPAQPAAPSFTSTPAYEKEIVAADAGKASQPPSVTSSTTAVSSSQTPSPTSRKEILTADASVATKTPPAPAPEVTVSTPPPAPKPLTQESYALSIRQSTSALSTQLGHAFLVVDGLNSQARRLSASSHPAHGLAVLEGMNTQAKRLQDDLTGASALYKTIIEQSRKIIVPEESFQSTVAGVTHASSVLDGIIVHSKRLVAASSVAAGSYSTDDQIMYMLSVLDGLNTQVKRLNVKETFGLLDELNSQAVDMA